ncbi:MAG: S8 family serine peptidase, partial [Actinomycetota bacterium]
MRGNPLRFAVVVAALVFAGGTGARATGPGTGTPPAGTIVPGEALVRFRPGTPAVAALAAHARAGASVVGMIRAIEYQRVRFDPAMPIQGVLASYRNDPSVAIAEPNYSARIAAAPNDPCFGGSCAGVTGQWALGMTNTPAGWPRVTGSTPTASQKRTLSRVMVAVLDTKVDAAHADFANAGGASSDAAAGGQLDLSGARDWIPPAQQGGAARYHGTYVAGLVAAATNNATGIASIGARATILPLTVVDGTGRADAASLADAIGYAHARGARVINLSLGLTADSQAVRDAIRAATQGTAPALVIAASGNNTGSTPFYPGSYPEVLSVAGTNASDGAASCSNYNANVSLSAPAERVVSLDAGGGLVAPPCGTSAAAPQVSGLAALLFAQDPARSPAEVRRLLER